MCRPDKPQSLSQRRDILLACLELIHTSPPNSATLLRGSLPLLEDQPQPPNPQPMALETQKASGQDVGLYWTEVRHPARSTRRRVPQATPDAAQHGSAANGLPSKCFDEISASGAVVTEAPNSSTIFPAFNIVGVARPVRTTRSLNKEGAATSRARGKSIHSSRVKCPQTSLNHHPVVKAQSPSAS